MNELCYILIISVFNFYYLHRSFHNLVKIEIWFFTKKKMIFENSYQQLITKLLKYSIWNNRYGLESHGAGFFYLKWVKRISYNVTAINFIQDIWIFMWVLSAITNNISIIPFIQDLNLNGSLNSFYKCSIKNIVLLFDTCQSIPAPFVLVLSPVWFDFLKFHL